MKYMTTHAPSRATYKSSPAVVPTLQTHSPAAKFRPADAVAYAAALEVLG